LGDAYRAAADVWRIHVWTLVFVSIVSLRSRLWVVEGHTRWILMVSAGTAALNVLANGWLIPRYGPIGAAWAGVVAWAASALVFPWCAPGPAKSMAAWCGLAKRD
jgi:O-antigen/teichoic acid export membrane protein